MRPNVLNIFLGRPALPVLTILGRPLGLFSIVPSVDNRSLLFVRSESLGCIASSNRVSGCVTA